MAIGLRPRGAYPPACKPYGLEAAPAAVNRRYLIERWTFLLRPAQRGYGETRERLPRRSLA